MRALDRPPSHQVTALSPTSFEVMRACRLRTSYRARPAGAQLERTAPQALGDLCHAVLEHLAQTRAILSRTWEEELDPAWRQLGDQIAAEIQEGPHEQDLAGPVETWPGARITRARLGRAARRLHELLRSAGERAELLCEEPLRSSQWPLQGRPDLVVRLPEDTWVIDYKTGSVVDAAGEARESYVRQLELYALLEAEASDRWPSRAILVPLNGQPIAIDVDRRVARGLAEEAAQLLADYNSTAPDPQPGSPSPELCRLCPYSPVCPSFWEAYDESWTQEFAALRGRLRRLDVAKSGSMTLLIERESSGDLAWVQSVAPLQHPGAEALQPGQRIALTGLREEDDGRAWSLPRWGGLGVLEEPAR